MSPRSRLKRFACAAAISVIALALPAASPAAAPAQRATSAATATVAVSGTGYSFDGRDFDDLGDVAASIDATHPARLDILVCTAGSARGFKAIVHRFHHLPLRIRLADGAECAAIAPVATSSTSPPGARPSGIDDAAVERYWQDIMP